MEKHLIIASLIILSFLIGRDMGYKDGVHNAYYATMADVHRQCESKFPLLVIDEFFTCKSTGRFLE